VNLYSFSSEASLVRWVHTLLSGKQCCLQPLAKAITTKCIHEITPTLLVDALQLVANLPGRWRLHSLILAIPPTWLHSTGDRAFPIAAARTNEALRVATGCHKMSHADHLHVETKLLPVKFHSELLAKQYWLSCYQSHHPCHHLTHCSSKNVEHPAAGSDIITNIVII